MSIHFLSRFAIRDRVYMDGCRSVAGVVTGFTFRDTRTPVVEVGWFVNGDAKSTWFEEWRLAPCEDHHVGTGSLDRPPTGSSLL